ncbi:MAG: hypothetical protein RLZZ303_2205 [Candidatus Hydrogenedentota bacterium]
MIDFVLHAPFVYHLALAIAMGAVTLLIPRGRMDSRIEAVFLGTLFGAVAVVGMLNPIQASHGIFFDGRSVLVCLSALYFGPWAGLVTAGMAGVLRAWIGGNGALPGIGVALVALLIGVIFHRRQKPPHGEWSAWQLLRIGVLVHLGMLATLFLALFNMPLSALMEVLRVATVPVLTLYPAAMILLGRILTVQTQQQRLLRAAREGEARLHKVIESAPIAMLLLDSGSRVVYANRRFVTSLGYTPDDIPTVEAWMQKAYPDPDYRASATTQWQADVQRARRGDGYLPPKEFMVRTKAGRTLAVEISATVIGEFIVVAFNDVTARREIERDAEFRRRLCAMLSQTNKLITHGADETALFEGICRIAVEDGGFKFAWYGSPREDGQVIPLARFGEDGGYVDALNITIDENDPRGQGPTGQVLRSGNSVVTNDFLAAVSTMPWKESAARLGVAASGVFAVRRRGAVVGALNFYSGEKDFFTPERIATLEEIASDVSFALDTLALDAEHAQAVAAVESLSARLAHYLDTSPVISYALVMDEGRVHTEWVSENIEALLGYPVEEALTDGWWASNLHAADRDAALDRLYDICALGELRHEYRFHRKDGSVLWVLDSMRLDQPEDGTARVFGAWTDINQLKENEESLRLQSAALNATANGIVVTDLAGNIEWVNPAFTTITGYTLEEVQGKNPKAVLKSGLHDEAYYKNLWETILSGQVWRGLLRNRRKDGTIYTEEQTITPIMNTKGEISRFVGVKVDVTEREQVAKVLRDSEMRLQRALQIGHIALWEWDLATGDIYYSP